MATSKGSHNSSASTNASEAPVRVELRGIPLSRIAVAEGFNPRGEVREDAELEALAETIRQRGCLQPIRVRTSETGEYVLIAGERRYRAAALAGLTEIPAAVVPAGAGDESECLNWLSDAMVENELRSDLDPVQRALGYQAMIDGGLSVRGVAERLGGKAKRASREQRIKEHLAILNLPGDLRDRVAAGVIPLLAVKALVGLCEIHEDLARAAVTAAEPGNDYEEPYSWSEIAQSPLTIAVNCCEQLPAGVYPTRNTYTLDAFTVTEKAQRDLDAYRELTGREIQNIRFSSEQVEQAKALGAVHEAGWLQVIVGQDVAGRLLEDQAAQTLKDARARARALERDGGDRTSDGHEQGESDADAASRLRDEAAVERRRQQQQRELAVSFNVELGLLAFKHLTRVKVGERVLRILASVDVGGQLRGLSSRGARLSLPGWVTQSEQRKGRSKTQYLEPQDAHRKAVEFLQGAETAAEIAGRTLTLIALAVFADENAIAQPRRSFHMVTFRGPWTEHAEGDLHGIARERIKEGQLPALDEALAENGVGRA